MKKKVFLILLCGVCLIGLTGCGSNNNVTKALNDISDSIVEDWKNKEYHYDFAVVKIQNKLDSYVIVSSGDSEYKNAISSSSYTEKPEKYDGESYDSMRMMNSDSKVNYFLVLDKNSNKYYSVKIDYKAMKLNGSAEYEYPTFVSAKEVK